MKIALRWKWIELADADVRLVRGWLPRAATDQLFAQLHEEIFWERHRLKWFGREIDAPRLSCWIGDANAIYKYSGTRFSPRPWTSTLSALQERVSNACGADFNSVLANLYRDGQDAMGWHSDDEPELDSTPVIASLSLGATRRFRLRDKRDPSNTRVLELGHGDLLRMAGATQRHYKHDLPRTRKAVGARINLTFRAIAPRASASANRAAPR
ncbi:MAG: alpha-ketoglutarate-dependent dioxygenase AlkB [Rhodanobacteraceae bacterium]|nr:alpha-ketoglutarate-dependent dioxygenase AlkB [Pseudomonadota bacterium]